jgi:hypothetical protein
MSGYSGKNYDVSSMFFTQEWESRFDEVNLTEEYYFELIADKVLRGWASG